MSILDEHNRQHTHGNSLGPPTSVVAASAQQAIDANKRLVGRGQEGSSSHGALRSNDHLRLALGCGVVVAVAVLVAFFVGGIGAVAAGLIAVIAGLIGVVFLVGALLGAK